MTDTTGERRHLRDGTSTDDPRLDRITELDPRSRSFPVTASLPAAPTLRDHVWRLDRRLMGDQGREGACFPAGTLIELADGSHEPIETIRTLQSVRTAEGGIGQVLATSARLHTQGLITLKLRGHKHLKATPEHPVLTTSGYVPMKDLRIGDEVRLPGVVPEARPASEQHIVPAYWLSESEQRVRTGVRWASAQGRGEVTATVARAPERIELSRGFGRIVGLWLAEGSTTANRVSWSFGAHERDTLVADLMDHLRRELGVEPRLQVRGNGSLVVNVYGKHWRMLFERMLSIGPYDKTLPAALASGPPAFLDAVLQGWLDGDGHRRRGRWAGITVSHRLALAMYRIAQALGKSPTISVSAPSLNRHAATRRVRWEVGIADGAHARVDDDGVWRKVVGLEHEEWAGFVHNLEVGGDHSYIAEGVGVHNCVEFGLSHVLAAMPITQALRVLQAVRARHLIYWPAQGQRTPWLPAGWTGDPWPGGSYPGASPVYEGTSELTGMKVAQQLGFIGGYEWAFRFDDAVAGVLHVGAANLALGWTQGMMDARPDGLIEDTGNVVGGHDVAWIGCLFGKRMRSDGRGGPRRDVAVIAQSWGLGYGDRGRVYVPLEDLQRRLADDGTCAFVNGEKKVSEVPPA
jgi:hypothetical protein